jgi:hypothetical protein
MQRKICHIPSFEENASCTRRQSAGNHAKDGRFTGTVGTDQADDLPGLDVQAYVTDDLPTKETFGESFRLQ